MWMLFFLFVVLIFVLLYFLLSSSSTSSTTCSGNYASLPSGSVISLHEKYDVFISFRGKDTRYGFTSHLYAALSQKQILTYVDNDLKKGNEISTDLLKAIQDSKISIIIFSKDYASSSWCLDELAHMLECKKRNPKYVVIPIFYCIDPFNVRRQKGSYESSLSKLENRFKPQKDKVKSWRNALTEAANLGGFHYDQTRNESELIKEIVEDILQKLNIASPNELNLKLYKGFIGVEKQIEEIESLLHVESKDDVVHRVGIWGMGGIGKTSLASVLFNKLSSQFEGSCFLANVREEWDKFGPNHLRDKLFSNLFQETNLNLGGIEPKPSIKVRLQRIKVFIALDDVNSSRQVEFLLVHQFAFGSRIIITTRNKQVLRNEADEIYEVEKLNLDDSFELFKSHAFKPINDDQTCSIDHDDEHTCMDELSNKVVMYANGVPLALKVLGSFLRNRSKEEWDSTLKKLKTVPNNEIESVLKISYDGLDDSEKNIFLDIACFFKGSDKDDVRRILDGCGFSASIGLSVLIDMSLVSIGYENKLWMHDMIQEMGWHIVKKESDMEPGRRSRLWVAEDVYHVFKNNTGTEAIQGIFLDTSVIRRINLNPTIFSKMYNLRLLKIYNSKSNTMCKIFLPKGLELLPDKLRYLYWVKYPLKFLPSKFSLENLVELWLPNSDIEQLAEEVINKTFTETMEQSYIYEDDDEEEEEEYKLVKLDVENCKDLKSIRRDSYKMKSLLYCNLTGCSSISKLPEFPSYIKELNLSGTVVKILPSSIQYMSSVEYLYLDHCQSLENLASSFKSLTKLQALSLRNCKRLKNIPELPISCEEVDATGCTSLEIVPSLSASINDQDWDRYVASMCDDETLKISELFQFFNCDKLDQTSLDNILDDAQILFFRTATAKLSKLNSASPNELNLKLHKGFIGVEKQIEEIESLLRVESKDDVVHRVGIWGMGGIGKTSLASVLFNKLSSQFEGACFLANVSEEWDKFGPNHLRDKLFSNLLEKTNRNLGGTQPKSFIKLRLERKKVFIVLDGVNSSRQVEFLLIDQFARGSRIIITTRNKQVLRNKADKIYEVEKLNLNDSLKLFKYHAFKPINDDQTCSINHDDEHTCMDELSNKVVMYANGVPLALKVLGSFFRNRSKEKLDSTLKKLKTVPNNEIESVLKISYDGLNDSEKNIFLDIACFFKGSDKDDVRRILDGCGFSASIGLSVLIDMSLVSIGYENKLWMHDMIQEMGWHIVKKESDMEPGRRSRLWVAEDVYHVFKNNTETEAIQGIFLDTSMIRRINLNPGIFSRMHNLRLLKIYNSKSNTLCKILLPKGLESLPDKLRYLYWVKYPLKILPSNFALKNLVELWLPNSHVEQLGEEVINKTFTGTMEQSYISKVDDDDDEEKEYKLVKLDVENCKDLKSIPRDSYKMKALLYCNMKGCSSIYKLPEFSSHIKELNLSGTAVQVLPSSIQYMSFVEYLYLENCESLESLPSSFKLLTKLKELSLRNCKRLKNIPELPIILSCEVNAEGCTSLEMVPSFSASINDQDWVRYVASMKDYESFEVEVFDFFNCDKLDQTSLDNISDDAQIVFLRAATAKLSNLHYDPSMGVSVSCCYPGKEIPSWFDHQKEGSSITMKLPPKWCHGKCLGFAICSVFELGSESKFEIDVELILKSGYGKCETIPLEDPEALTKSDGSHVYSFLSTPLRKPETLTKSRTSHVYVSYRTLRLFNAIKCCSIETVAFNFRLQPISYLGEKGKMLGKENRAKVNKCGITLVYAQAADTTERPIGFQPI